MARRNQSGRGGRGRFRYHTLPQTAFRDPRQMLFLLNDVFMAEQNNNIFFAICYGVYNTSSD
jgi:serine phosphatase RsbU (regulator of sigma subunit)